MQIESAYIENSFRKWRQEPVFYICFGDSQDEYEANDEEVEAVDKLVEQGRLGNAHEQDSWLNGLKKIPNIPLQDEV